MKRRSLLRRPHSAGLDRWLVSYADYMTLVFALFVMLYAIHASQSDEQQPLLAGMQQALTRLGGVPPVTVSSGLALAEPSSPSEAPSTGAEGPPSPEPVALAEIRQGLSEQLAPLLEQQLVSLEQQGDWLSLHIDGGLLFASGSALLGPNGAPLLGSVVPVLQRANHFIRVRGYADAQPISNELYASNWQLSAERARAVLEWLAGAGIAQPRLALEAYGAQRPRDDARGGAGRMMNRRVEIAVSARQWQPPPSLPSRPLAEADAGGVRVYELPGGGIRISTGQD